MKKRTMILSILFLLTGTFLGFADTNLNLKIKFDQIYGLKKGDRVIYELNHIGEVGNVNYGKDGIYNVEVTIKNNFANAATESSEFFIIDDPQKKGSKVVEVILVQTGGVLLKDGATVEGSSNRSMILEKLEMDIERGLEYLKREYEKFQNQVDKIPESKEYQELKRKLANLLEQLKLTSKETHDKIQKELIPKIKEELDRIEETIKKFGEEKQTKPSENQLAKPKKI